MRRETLAEEGLKDGLLENVIRLGVGASAQWERWGFKSAVMSGLGLGGRPRAMWRLRRVEEEGRRETREGSQAQLASALSVSSNLGPRGCTAPLP